MSPGANSHANLTFGTNRAIYFNHCFNRSFLEEWQQKITLQIRLIEK
jgi:hypothetical protein